MIVNDTAVRTNRNVNSRFFVIFISRLGNFDNRRCLTSADSFRFAGYTNRTTADTYLDEIRARFGKEQKSVLIDNVSRADFNLIAIFFSYEFDGFFLPAGVTLGRIDTKNVRARFYESGNSHNRAC